MRVMKRVITARAARHNIAMTPLLFLPTEVSLRLIFEGGDPKSASMAGSTLIAKIRFRQLRQLEQRVLADDLTTQMGKSGYITANSIFLMKGLHGIDRPFAANSTPFQNLIRSAAPDIYQRAKGRLKQKDEPGSSILL